ncbi:hypothetical protein HanRHA438_Chr01g0002411 [Helianthus annuus]|nr:hypothetical protein HanRHA438_Chr01g0002411 [Helianthus annuus]
MGQYHGGIQVQKEPGTEAKDVLDNENVKKEILIMTSLASVMLRSFMLTVEDHEW